MDKFVTVTEKCYLRVKLVIVIVLQQETVVRKFNSQWENDYFVTENKGKTMCLVCWPEFADNKKHTIERHFTSQHSYRHTKFLDSTRREIEIARLKNEMQADKKGFEMF